MPKPAEKARPIESVLNTPSSDAADKRLLFTFSNHRTFLSTKAKTGTPSGPPERVYTPATQPTAPAPNIFGKFSNLAVSHALKVSNSEAGDLLAMLNWRGLRAPLTVPIRPVVLLQPHLLVAQLVHQAYLETVRLVIHFLGHLVRHRQRPPAGLVVPSPLAPWIPIARHQQGLAVAHPKVRLLYSSLISTIPPRERRISRLLQASLLIGIDRSRLASFVCTGSDKC